MTSAGGRGWQNSEIRYTAPCPPPQSCTRQERATLPTATALLPKGTFQKPILWTTTSQAKTLCIPFSPLCAARVAMTTKRTFLPARVTSQPRSGAALNIERYNESPNVGDSSTILELDTPWFFVSTGVHSKMSRPCEASSTRVHPLTPPPQTSKLYAQLRRPVSTARVQTRERVAASLTFRQFPAFNYSLQNLASSGDSDTWKW